MCVYILYIQKYPQIDRYLNFVLPEHQPQESSIHQAHELKRGQCISVALMVYFYFFRWKTTFQLIIWTQQMMPLNYLYFNSATGLSHGLFLYASGHFKDGITFRWEQ